MNPAQIRPPAARSSQRLLALLIALSACNSADRDPPRHTPTPTSPLIPTPTSPLIPTPTSPLVPTPTPIPTPTPTLIATPTPIPTPSLIPAPAPPPLPASPTPDTPPHNPHHYVVAAIGDSLTDPRSHGGGYLEYLKTRCPTLELDNFGKGATMVNQMRRRFEEQLVSSGKHYTHLIIFGGVNDLYSDLTAFRTPAKIEDDLGAMYAWGQAHELKVIALTVAPWGGFSRYFNPSRARATRELNAWIRRQASEGHVDQVVDAHGLLSCGDPDSLCKHFSKPFKDGLHFGPDGHQLLGQALFRSAFSECE